MRQRVPNSDRHFDRGVLIELLGVVLRGSGAGNRGKPIVTNLRSNYIDDRQIKERNRKQENRHPATQITRLH
ncbi:MAG TPA: hypothetical protein VI260_05330 [Blastocatellia bacterium]